jgi:hypothetical protein
MVVNFISEGNWSTWRKIVTLNLIMTSFVIGHSIVDVRTSTGRRRRT